jgi:hypothetical protein
MTMPTPLSRSFQKYANVFSRPVGRRHALPSQGMALRHNSGYVAVFVRRCT